MSSQKMIDKIIDLAIEEDCKDGDITTDTLIPKNLGGRAFIIAKEEGLLVGGEIAGLIFLKTDQELRSEVLVEDGNRVKPGDTILVVQGRVASILKAERIVLNFISHLTGIATEAGKYVKAMEGTNVELKDTRKTIPGNRILEKYAVYVAGGKPHRPNLASGFIIKDNHLVALKSKECGIKEALELAREKAPKGMPVEIEVNTIEQLKEAIEAKPDVIMLDNMSLDDMKKAIDLVPEDIKIEASGGITLENISEVAMTGVDAISVGAITNSVRAVDFSLSFGSET